MEQGEGAVTVEQAAHEDAEVLAELLVEAFPDKFGPIIGERAAALMVERAEAEARRLGKGALSLQVVSHNADAIRLYERLGFELGPRKQSRLLRWTIGRPGYHKMVKPLA